MAEDEEDPKLPWTIKAVPASVRKRAVACATKQDQSMAEWITGAVNTRANLEAGERILPPLVPGRLAEHPSALRETSAAAPAPVAGGMTELAELLRTAVEVGRAGGVPVPKGVARQAFTLVHERLRAARGLPLRPRRTSACAGARRLPNGQTQPRNGQTVAPDGVLTHVAPDGAQSRDGKEAADG